MAPPVPLAPYFAIFVEKLESVRLMLSGISSLALM